MEYYILIVIYILQSTPNLILQSSCQKVYSSQHLKRIKFILKQERILVLCFKCWLLYKLHTFLDRAELK